MAFANGDSVALTRFAAEASDDGAAEARAGAAFLRVSARRGDTSSPLGRPSIDPVLMIRMLIVGYVFAIRSERLLCREVQVNLAYRWFCGLSIEDKIPDHSAFSRARNERFRDSNIFRRVFERVVQACINAGLVGGEGFAVDASLIVADANKQRSVPGSQWRRHRGCRSLARHPTGPSSSGSFSNVAALPTPRMN